MVPSRLGSCSTRTAHPYFLHQFEAAVAALGMNHRTLNPFMFSTKGEMLQTSRNAAFLQSLAPMTISCSHPDAGRWQGLPYANCGYCIPCLIRRAAMHSVGLDDPADYSFDPLTDSSLHSGTSDRGRDARTAATLVSRGGSDLRILANGPLPEGVDLVAIGDVFKNGVHEMGKLLDDRSASSVRKLLWN